MYFHEYSWKQHPSKLTIIYKPVTILNHKSKQLTCTWGKVLTSPDCMLPALETITERCKWEFAYLDVKYKMCILAKGYIKFTLSGLGVCFSTRVPWMVHISSLNFIINRIQKYNDDYVIIMITIINMILSNISTQDLG